VSARKELLANPYGTYLSWVQQEKAPRTHEKYTHVLGLYAREYPNPWVADWDDIERWTSRPRRNGPPSPFTRHTETTVLKAFYRWCAVRAQTVDPTLGRRTPRRPARVQHRAVDRRLLEQVVALELQPGRRLAFLLMLDCGLRADEACSLTGGQVKRQGKGYLLVRGKGGDDRIVPVTKRVGVHLAQAAANRRDGERLVRTLNGTPVSPKRLWQWSVDAGLRAGVEKLNPHRWRHSYACYLYYEKHVLLPVLQRLLGHSKLTTTQAYLGVRDEELFDVVQLLG
jgi:integrase/recombinase XerD